MYMYTSIVQLVISYKEELLRLPNRGQISAPTVPSCDSNDHIENGIKDLTPIKTHQLHSMNKLLMTSTFHVTCSGNIFNDVIVGVISKCKKCNVVAKCPTTSTAKVVVTNK